METKNEEIITSEEFKNFIWKFNRNYSEYEINFIFNRILKNEKFIQMKNIYEEVNIIWKNFKNTNEIKDAFDLFDRGNKKYIDYCDIEKVCNLIGENFESVKNLYKISKSIRISFDEFMKFLDES